MEKTGLTRETVRKRMGCLFGYFFFDGGELKYT